MAWWHVADLSWHRHVSGGYADRVAECHHGTMSLFKVNTLRYVTINKAKRNQQRITDVTSDILKSNGLTHWSGVTHTCVGKLTIIASDNGLSHGRRQAIIWTNAGILLIEPLGTNFSETLITIHTFPFKKIHLKMSSGKWRPACLGLNVLNHWLNKDLNNQWKKIKFRSLNYDFV